MAGPPSASVKKIAGAIAVVLIFVAGTSLLMTSLRSAKMASFRKQLEGDMVYRAAGPAEPHVAYRPAETGGERAAPPRTLAHVKTFVAKIELTPKLSVGTDKPESIYEAQFQAEISAVSPVPAQGGGEQECSVGLPLPPNLISLADLTVTVNGEPSESMSVDRDKLIWQGHLDQETPAKFNVTYTAMGRGIYTLQPPPGRIVDVFEATLTANRSNIRMLELSLQPENPVREPGKTTYAWKYKRLMFGRPIALDVLGIAPVDQLGELVWLGPISVLVFGLIAALVALAFRPERLDKWMLLLIVGTFAGGYPLMYFAQDFLSLGTAVIGAAAVVVIIVGTRGVTLFGPALGLLGTVVLAGAIQAITLSATIWSQMQGVLLTVMAIGTLVVAMMLLPRAQKNLAAAEQVESPKPTPPERPPSPTTCA